MKVLKKFFGLDMNRRFCVERSDYVWEQIEHAVYRIFSDKTIVCAMVLESKLVAVDMMDTV